jgi:hypothetical protein
MGARFRHEERKGERDTKETGRNKPRRGEKGKAEKLLQGLMRILISDDDQRLVVRHSRIHHA